jgi:hypothetical protein
MFNIIKALDNESLERKVQILESILQTFKMELQMNQEVKG